jgi:hypothetical protein
MNPIRINRTFCKHVIHHSLALFEYSERHVNQVVFPKLVQWYNWYSGTRWYAGTVVQAGIYFLSAATPDFTNIS